MEDQNERQGAKTQRIKWQDRDRRQDSVSKRQREIEGQQERVDESSTAVD